MYGTCMVRGDRGIREVRVGKELGDSLPSDPREQKESLKIGSEGLLKGLVDQQRQERACNRDLGDLDVILRF